MSRILTKEEGDNIVKLYEQGCSYRDIAEKTGHSDTTITKRVKGMRSSREAQLLARSKGKGLLTEEGRAKLTEHGKTACLRTGKFYTKPEREFKLLLNGIGIGVRFPDFVKEVKGIEDDDLSVSFLYQYPIQRYVLDYANPEKRIAININGDYWHANPSLYNQEMLGKLQQVNVRQDKNKRAYLEKNGWVVLDIWESEIYWNQQLVYEKLRAVGVMETCVVYTHDSGVRISHCPPEDWSETLKRLWFKKDRKPRTKAIFVKEVCRCGKEFTHRENRKQKFCSVECVGVFSRKERPTKEELVVLVSEFPMTTIASRYGVTDNAVKKWCRGYGIEIGDRRGYWAKKRSSK